jgi:hypothetical protein
MKISETNVCEEFIFWRVQIWCLETVMVILTFALLATALAMVPVRRLAGTCTGTEVKGKSDTNSSALNSTQCAAWQAGFDAMNGTGWEEPCRRNRDDPCGCEKVRCVGGSITYFDGNNIGVAGTLPDEFMDLVDLEELFLGQQKSGGPAQGGQLTGSLPVAWSTLTKIQKLYVFGHGGLGGTLPAAWVAMTALTKLRLDSNGLTGELPTAWRDLPRIEYVQLSKNMLTGGLPAVWAECTSLDTLFLYSNDLGGSLPAAWSALERMLDLRVYDNKLTGSLPAAWSAMTAMKKLDVSVNLLTGPLPPTWASMTDMETLDVHSNDLSGELPKEYGNLTKMEYLIVGSNKFVGDLPVAYGAFTELKWLYLSKNLLTGEIPKEWKTIGSKGIQRIGVNKNRLTGPIHDDLVGTLLHGGLQSCGLGENRFRCPLPAGLPSTCSSAKQETWCPSCASGQPTCCPTGKFNIPPKTEECLACPSASTGNSSDAGADCFVCRDACGGAPCPKGMYGWWTAEANHTCTACSRGQFQDVFGAEGSNSCKSCGTVTNGALIDAASGSDSKEDCGRIICSTGQAPASTDAIKCVNCTAGRFKAGRNAKACENCPCGQWQNQPGQGTCGAACKAGTFGNSTTGQCAPCPSRGFFCIEAQKIPFAKALRCSPGEYERSAPTVAADRVCAKCAPGNFSNASNLLECFACGDDEFQPSAGQGFCTRHRTCAVGERQTVAPTATSDRTCNECAAGTFSNASNLLECFACGDDEFQPSAGQGSCTRHTVCAAGEQQTVAPTATSDRTCNECAAGTFSNASNLLECFACGDDEFQPSAGQGSCTRHTVCVAGEHRSVPPTSTSDRVCAPCALGTFSAAGASDCTACGGCGKAGEARSGCGGASAGVCIACSMGSSKPGTGAGECVPCAADSFQNVTGQAQCIMCRSVACPGGAYRKGCGGASAGYCGTCGPGTFVNGSACEKCAVGKFSEDENARGCKACADETFQPTRGKGFCRPHTLCAVGEYQITAPTVTSDRTCNECAAGTFSNASNLLECFACGDDEFQPSAGQGSCTRHTVCAVGEQQTVAPTATSDRTCNECAAGTFSNASNLLECFACGNGDFQPLAGQGFCTRHKTCVAGERQALPPTSTADRACEKCAASTFSDTSNAEGCEACPAGKFQGTAGQPFCEPVQPCAQGTFDANTSDTSPARCRPCPEGYWCQGNATQPCGAANLFCPPRSSTPFAVAIGHYSVPTNSSPFQRTGQMPCESGFTCNDGVRKACPPGRLCEIGNSTAIVAGSAVKVTTERRCDASEFAFEGECLPCPKQGAKCDDGQIELKPDFWYDPDHGPLDQFWGKRQDGSALGIYRCAPGSCVRNALSGLPDCAPGRTGLLCAICQINYFSADGLSCKPCPAVADTAGRVVILLAFVAVSGTALWLTKRKLRAKHPKLYAGISEKLPEVLKLLTGMFQILGAFATVLYRVPWPGAFRQITSIASVLTLDVFALPSISCSSLGSTYYGRFDMHMTTMLAITGLFVVLLVYAYSRHNQSRARPLSTDLVWNCFLPFLFIIYPSISKTAILMLRCRIIDGNSFLLADLALSCETAEYASHKAYAIFGVLVFPVGVAVFFAALVGYNRRKLPPDWWPARAPAAAQEAYEKYRSKRLGAKPFASWRTEAWDPQMAKYNKIHKRIGFLFFAYTKDFWWFESLILVYKLTMTVLVIFVSDGDENKILFGMLGATTMMGILSFCQPFRHASILSINTVGQIVVLVVLFAAMFLLLNGGGSIFLVATLVLATFAPLVAGIALTLQLPEEALTREAGDGLFSAFSGFKSKSDAASADDDEPECEVVRDSAFSADNPMFVAEAAAELSERESALVAHEEASGNGDAARQSGNPKVGHREGFQDAQGKQLKSPSDMSRQRQQREKLAGGSGKAMI